MPKLVVKNPDWSAAMNRLKGRISAEEEILLRHLAAGKTQPAIGTILGLHRGAVWRRVKRLRQIIESEQAT